MKTIAAKLGVIMKWDNLLIYKASVLESGRC